MEQIAVTHVSKDFPDASGKPFSALRDISFVWTKGENISLMGESGSGKSTMARLLIGLDRPTQGKILMDGEDTSKWSYNQCVDTGQGTGCFSGCNRQPEQAVLCGPKSGGASAQSDQANLPREESADFRTDGPDGHQPQAAGHSGKKPVRG